MPEFLIELYVSRGAAACARRTASRARRVADDLAREGTPIVYVRSIFVPEDETCFVLYEAPSAASVLEAARRAGLAWDRVVKTGRADRRAH